MFILLSSILQGYFKTDKLQALNDNSQVTRQEQLKWTLSITKDLGLSSQSRELGNKLRQQEEEASCLS